MRAVSVGRIDCWWKTWLFSAPHEAHLTDSLSLCCVVLPEIFLVFQLLPDVGPSLSPFLLSSTGSFHVLLITDVGVRQLGFTWMALRSAGQLKDKL